MTLHKRAEFTHLPGATATFDLQSIPYKVLISMEDQHERRRNAFRQFAGLGLLDVKWKTPVKIEDIEWAKLPTSYLGHPKYASQALTLIEVFEDAKRRHCESFMLFEDDIIFHPHFHLLLPQIEVPENWKFVYIGGRNCRAKRHISAGLVKSSFISDLHAVAIRAVMIESLTQVLLDSKMKTHWADARIASLHTNYPAYLCRPNLAWQSIHSDGSGSEETYSNYNEDGSVKRGQGD